MKPKVRESIHVNAPEELRKYLGTSIYFCIPTRGNDIYHEQVTFLLRQFKLFENATLFYGINGHKCAIELVLERLTQREFDYAYFMDADIGPDPLTPLRLIGRQLDVVHSPVWMYDPNANDIHLNCHDEREEEIYFRSHVPLEKTGLQRIISGSMASVLISKKVIDTFKKENESFTSWSPLLDKELDGQSADVIFYAKIEKFGFEQYMDWDVPFSVHHRLVELCPNSLDFFCFARAGEMMAMRADGMKVPYVTWPPADN